MERSSGTETVSGILAAFTRQSSWEEHVLARELGVSTAVLRGHLDALGPSVPLSRTGEPKDGIVWSVPRGWQPKPRPERLGVVDCWRAGLRLK